MSTHCFGSSLDTNFNKLILQTVGIYQYVAQTREELDVSIGLPYFVITRDNDWAIVENKSFKRQSSCEMHRG